MSDTVLSHGYIAVLKTPLGEPEREELSERASRVESDIGFTYDGECAYIDYNRKTRDPEDIYGCWFGISKGDPDHLIQEAKKYNLEIELETIVPYVCIWYNGSDFPINTEKSEDIRARAHAYQGSARYGQKHPGTEDGKAGV